MRQLPLALSPLLALLAWPARGQEQTPPTSNPRTSFAESETARMEKEIQGAWMLIEYQPGDSVMDQTNARGSLIFHEGYMSIVLQTRRLSRGLITNLPEFFVQAGMHRYRIDSFQTLQTSAMLGFVAEDLGGTISFDDDNFAREHKITLDGDRLTMHRDEGGWMTFARLGRGEFPEQAAQSLDATRGTLRRDD